MRVVQSGLALQHRGERRRRVLSRGAAQRCDVFGKRLLRRLRLLFRAAVEFTPETRLDVFALGVHRHKSIACIFAAGHTRAFAIGLIFVGACEHEAVGVEVRRVPVEKAREQAGERLAVRRHALEDAIPGLADAIDPVAEVRMILRQVTELVREHCTHLIGRQTGEQRQADDEIALRQPQQAELRRVC